ncbi:MAG: hypothetical protein WB698_05825 [Solirubrobacteraceae bacterium]
MSRQRVVDIALRAYPPAVRNARGTEMRDTALDLSDHSVWRLIVESLGLARGGLKARASGSATASKRDLLSDCCARTAAVCGLVIFTVWLGEERWAYTSPHTIVTQSTGQVIAEGVLLALATGLALVGYRRLAGLSGVAWVGFYLARVLSRPPSWWLPHPSFAYDMHWVAMIIVPLACYVVMIVAPGAAQHRSARLGWLLGAWLLGGIVAEPNAPLELFGSIGLENVLLISILIVGTCSLAVDTWRPVALALTLLSFGLGAWTWASTFDDYEYLPLALTTLGPVMLMAGTAARLLTARRGLPS